MPHFHKSVCSVAMDWDANLKSVALAHNLRT